MVTIRDEEIRRQLGLGEDSRWEFKQVEFHGGKPISPRRDDWADELGAFANADGGTMLCGVADDGTIQGMSREQAVTLDRLLAEVSTDSIEPPLRIDVYHRELDGKAFVLVVVPRGEALHERGGRAFIRVGASKRRMTKDESLRLAQNRAQSRYLWFDKQIVPETGFETLSERLWEPLLSAAGAADARRGLMNLRLLAQDEAGVERATVAGILLCAPSPQNWLPQATIAATHYRGADRASGQLDAQEITGPLSTQIADAVQFVVRNMRVSARKTPEREDIPQYSKAAVFEAVANAVAHRDYSISSRRIRLSIFKDRLEIDSPGRLPNGMTIEGMEASQATRNEVIASVFGRIPVGGVAGAGHRKFLMERRGDGVAIIRKETREATGLAPEYELINGSSLALRIPAAKLDLVPADATITVHSKGEPLAGVEVLALFPNKTWVRGTTDEAGDAALDLYTANLPMTVYAAAPGYAAGLKRDWAPNRGGLLVELEPLESGGATIFAQSTGHIPGLRGRLNPIRDTSDRTYLYADNIAINEGRQQPVPFRIGKRMRLTDAFGAELSVTVVDILGRSSLIEYQPFNKRD
ncbi:MAG: putative DNA binding domain-containing protein [Gammaproteobacteria bacterium]|nr:putative DNA binding domain-containing protein [Gammaproteobacteria bacterium]MCY4256463.1 putative DNA binding domain-containing protein [Gammaproteobacteria bacterium]MCY4340618.1 putative DNA binding domain-containing protein [Gammaproteobacteria bacterium]